MYAETLKSTSIGQTVIFQAMSKTTQDVINTFSTLGPKNFGLVSIAADQTNGRGEINYYTCQINDQLFLFDVA